MDIYFSTYTAETVSYSAAPGRGFRNGTIVRGEYVRKFQYIPLRQVGAIFYSREIPLKLHS